MATHHDDDHGNPEMNRAIRSLFSDKAEALSRERLNLITAGEPDERPLYQETVGDVTLIRMPDDPLALRISIGEATDLDEGMYFVFRGQPSKIKILLQTALAALKTSHRSTKVR